MARQLRQAGEQFTVQDSEIVQGGDKETSYTIRVLTRGDYKRIFAQHKKTVRGQEIVDGPGLKEDLIDFVLVDWTGIVVNGEPAPCTRDYKLMLDLDIAEALLERAGMSQIVAQEAARGESFRPPA